MSASFIPVNEPCLVGNEKAYLTECIESGWISSEGPFVEKFEAAVAQKVGRRHAIAVSSGSAALEVALACLDIGPGDEVILPTHTIISCASAIARAGATPVLVDSDLLTWNLRVSEIESKITKRTRAIMVVHVYGLPVEMNPVLALAKKYGLKIIEDAAEMIGQTESGRPCGSFGEISTFSFYPNKLITTGEGGMVLTDDDRLAERARGFRNLCFQSSRRFYHEELGWNFRLSNLHAAVGLAQTERWEKSIETKRWIGRRYTELLADLPQVQLPLARTSTAENIYWVYGLVLTDAAGMSAAEAMKKLAALGIGTRPFFWPMHQQPVFTKRGLFLNDSHPHAEYLARMGLYIPSGLVLTEAQILATAKAIRSLWE